MPETHIITCGISLLTNTVRSLSNRESPIPREKLQGLSDTRRIQETLASLSREEREALEGAMLSLLRENPKMASAEMNALLSYAEEFNPSIESVHLISSDTEEGRLTASVLARYLTELGHEVHEHSVEGFGSEDFDRALIKLKERVRRIVERHHSVVLNLTGGFKAEIAALSVLAAESGLRAYYIHEAAKKVVILPTASQLKVRTTIWEKVLAVLMIILSIPMDSLLGFPLFILAEAAVLIPAIWIVLRRA